MSLNIGTQLTTDNPQEQRVDIRRYPFTPVMLTGTDVASGKLVFTSPANEAAELAGLVLSGGGSATFVLRVDGVDTVAIGRVTIPTTGVLDLGGMLMVPPNGELHAYGDARVAGWIRGHL